MVYTLSEGLSSMTHRKDLVKCRVAAFANQILDGPWLNKRIHVWGAGRDGRCFLNELALLGRASTVAALYDVDDAKLGTYHNGATGLSMPVLHIDQIRAPFVVCVSMRNPELVSFVRAAAERLGAAVGVHMRIERSAPNEPFNLERWPRYWAKASQKQLEQKQLEQKTARTKNS